MKRYVTDEQRSRRPIFIATLQAAASWLFFKAVRAGLAVTTSLSELIRKERETRKISQMATDRRVAMKMDRRRRCSSVTYRSRYAPSSRLADGPF